MFQLPTYLYFCMIACIGLSFVYWLSNRKGFQQLYFLNDYDICNHMRQWLPLIMRHVYHKLSNWGVQSTKRLTLPDISGTLPCYVCVVSVRSIPPMSWADGITHMRVRNSELGLFYTRQNHNADVIMVLLFFKNIVI